MALSAISGAQNAAAAVQTQQTTGNPELGQMEFLNLLITQLQNQDPLNPQDSSEFAAQLAQFTTLEQMISINENFENLTSAQTALSKLGALSLIGREVLISSDSLSIVNGEAPNVQFNLSDAAETVMIKYYDSNGQEVGSQQETNLAEGNHSIAWAGMDDQGEPLPDGEYTYEIVALDANDEMVTAIPSTSHVVTGVEFVNGETYLQTQTGLINMGQVISVRQVEEELISRASLAATDVLYPTKPVGQSEAQQRF